MRWFERLGTLPYIHTLYKYVYTTAFMVWAVTSSNEKSNQGDGGATLSSGHGHGPKPEPGIWDLGLGLCGPNGSFADRPLLSLGGHQSRRAPKLTSSPATPMRRIFTPTPAHWFVYAVFGVCFVRPALKPFPFAALPTLNPTGKWNADANPNETENAIKMCLLSHLCYVMLLPWPVASHGGLNI